MILHRDPDTRREADPVPSGLAPLGRALRRARLSQGLGEVDASRQSGLTTVEIEALESGRPGALPNPVHTVNLLRRYAGYLGLPADRFALALLDAWPVGMGSSAPLAGASLAPSVSDATAAVPQVSESSPWAHPGAAPWPGGSSPTATVPVSTVGEAAPPDVTGAVPLATAAVPAPEQVNDLAESSWTGEVPTYQGAEHPTGPVPVTPRTRSGGAAVIALRAMVALLAGLVLVGAVGLAIDHWKPQWLHSLEHGAQSTGANTSTSSPSQQGKSPNRAGNSSSQRSATGVSAPAVSSPTSATVTVDTRGASLELSATGGESWFQVEQQGKSSPIFAQTLQSGQHKSLPLSSTLTVLAGAGSARLAVQQGSKVLRSYTPPGAPYTYTFQTS